MATPRRRWFAFSLRTLFVMVTVLACWLGWNLHIVRTRQRQWQSINAAGGYSLSDGLSRIPTFRAWLGDKPRRIIAVPVERFSPDKIHEIEQTFDEATVLAGSQASMRREGDEDKE